MKRTALATVLAAFAVPVLAGDEGVVILEHHRELLAASDHSDAWKKWADDFSREMRASMGTLYAPRLGSHKTIKGAPYSAEVVTEITQTLSDGNTISRRKTGMIYRDGEGRTRQETAAEGKSPSVHINDPVEGKMYILSPGFKKAIVVPSFGFKEKDKEKDKLTKFDHKHEHRHRHVYRVDGTEIRIEDGKVFVDGKEAVGTMELVGRGNKKILIENGRVTIDGKDVVRRLGDGETLIRADEVQVRVVRAGDGFAPLPPVPPVPPTPPGALAPLPPMPPMPGVHTMRFESTAKLGKGVTTSLGSKSFDGIGAEGKATTWTIPAGEIGNKNPIHVVSETWYSPELQVTVQSRYNDPRTGETVYRLANIRRGEPSPDLFKVPEDYTTKQRGRS